MCLVLNNIVAQKGHSERIHGTYVYRESSLMVALQLIIMEV